MRQIASSAPEHDFEGDIREIEDALRRFTLPRDAASRGPSVESSRFPWRTLAFTATVLSIAVLGGLNAV